MYKFTRPDGDVWGEEAELDYDKCKGYIQQNSQYPVARGDRYQERQIRTHTCFTYCANGEDNNFLGDERQHCVDMPPHLRDSILCLYPDDTCEYTSVKG